jgi:hypothetical protein
MAWYGNSFIIRTSAAAAGCETTQYGETNSHISLRIQEDVVPVLN